MIKIKRASCPQTLKKDEDAFRKNDYSKDDVKKALLEMQHRKCCYCEINLDTLGSSIREVDHYIPKTAANFKNTSGKTQWHLANSWTNLLYSCRNCNSKKSNKHPFDQITSERRFIDPTFEDTNPENDIDFIIEEDFMMHNMRGKTNLGRTTCEMLQFYARSDLFNGFFKVSLGIKININNLIIALINDNTVECEAIKQKLSNAMSAHREFAAFQRAFIAKKIKSLNEVIIPKLEKMHDKSFDKITIVFPKGAEVLK